MIARLHQMLVNRKISSSELTELYLHAIALQNPTLRAYITVTADAARLAAQEADKRIKANLLRGPLDGIPMLLKDNLSTRSVQTTCASRMLLGYIPVYDATVWLRLQEQGAVLLGKGNMDEFGMGSTGQTSYFGTCLNPHDTNYVSGGSSGGVAAAVAGGLSVYGLGSDTGGSIRQPASFCGAVGFKPSYGAVSRYGLLAYASSLDQVGPITSSVEDASMLFRALCKPDPQDSTCQAHRVPLQLKHSTRSVAVPNGCRTGLQPEVLRIFDTVCDLLRQMGIDLQFVECPSFDFSVSAYYITACAEAASNLGRYDGVRFGHRTASYMDLNEFVCKNRAVGFGFEVKRRILLGNHLLHAGQNTLYSQAQAFRAKLCRELDQLYQSFDLLLLPTAPCTAFNRCLLEANMNNAFASDRFTVIANLAGLPAISIPAGFDSNSLPVGIQLIGKQFDDLLVLDCAQKLEQILNVKCSHAMGVGL